MKYKHSYFNIILLVFVLIFSNSCKKDYPSDIPQWIKEKIKMYKYLEDENHLKTPVSIVEYKDNNENCIYLFDYSPISGGVDRYDYYDSSGFEICSCIWCWNPGQGCTINGQLIHDVYKESRVIWSCRFCN